MVSMNLLNWTIALDWLGTFGWSRCEICTTIQWFVVDKSKPALILVLVQKLDMEAPVVPLEEVEAITAQAVTLVAAKDIDATFRSRYIGKQPHATSPFSSQTDS